MRLLAESAHPLALGEIARSIDLAKPTAYGLLKTLHDVGLVDKDPATARYRPVADAVPRKASWSDPNELRSRSMNYADSLAARTGQAVRVAALRDGEALVVHHVFRPGRPSSGRTAQRLEIGNRLPAHACALGKVLLAYGAGAVIMAGGEELVAMTSATLTDRVGLVEALAGVRRNGIAVEVSELVAGTAGIAAPIRAPGGLVIGAIGISGPEDELMVLGRQPARPRRPSVDQVVAAAAAISAEFADG